MNERSHSFLSYCFRLSIFSSRHLYLLLYIENFHITLRMQNIFFVKQNNQFWCLLLRTDLKQYTEAEGMQNSYRIAFDIIPLPSSIPKANRESSSLTHWGVYIYIYLHTPQIYQIYIFIFGKRIISVKELGIQYWRSHICIFVKGTHSLFINSNHILPKTL